MKTGVIETLSESGSNAPRSTGRIAADYAELVKARLTLLVLVTTAVGYYLAARSPVSPAGLLHAVFGTAWAAAGAAALNQWWERKVDALMQRTRTRPVPGGRMSAREAFIAGTVMSVIGVAYLSYF